MKTKNKKPAFNMDERNKQIAYQVISIMYLITILAMQGILLYRQFILGEEIERYEDIAVIVTINSIFLISALLYFGAIPIQKLKIWSILKIFILLVLVGSLFTWAKYNLFQDHNLSIHELWDKVQIIISIIGLMMGFWVLLSYLGKRRQEKELE